MKGVRGSVDHKAIAYSTNIMNNKPSKCCHPNCENCPYDDCMWDEINDDELNNTELEVYKLTHSKVRFKDNPKEYKKQYGYIYRITHKKEAHERYMADRENRIAYLREYQKTEKNKAYKRKYYLEHKEDYKRRKAESLARKKAEKELMKNGEE